MIFFPFHRKTNQNIENLEGDHQSILNILLQNPEDFNLKQKPSGIRENKMFTLDMREIPISSAKADDNGSYISKSTVAKFYMYNAEGSRTSHKDQNGVWYVNIRDSKGYKRQYVPEDEIYELRREYHTSKHNPNFSRSITTVKAYAEKEPRPFYVVMYKWADGVEQDFKLPRHGNATKPTSSQYYRKDHSLFAKVDNLLEKGLSTEQVYNSIARNGASTVSEVIPGPKLVDNRKLLLKAKETSTCSTDKKKFKSEAEEMISCLQTVSLLQSVTFTKESYVAFNSIPNMINDLHRFCVNGNSILRVDTTFELVEGLWLTDTTYTNEALIDLNGKNPEFPGPSFWHFRKTRECYRRFAGELVIKKPELLRIKKIGHDLDKALSQGLCDIFTDAKKLWCTQHMQERDLHKLKTLGCNQRSQSRVMADVYGTQDEVLIQNGLADAEDEFDFDAKLESLKTVWEEIAPDFHHWFQSNRSKLFKDCLLLSARENLSIEGSFYTNGLELKHKLQKKRMAEEDVPKEVAPVTAQLFTWAEDFYLEEERAIQGLGKYRLAVGNDHFQVDPVTWNRWGPTRQAQHLEAFRAFVPRSYDTYAKPKSAGLKATPNAKKRRTQLPEPELFTERISPPACKKVTVSPLVLSKVGKEAKWEVNNYIHLNTDIDIDILKVTLVIVPL